MIIIATGLSACTKTKYEEPQTNEVTEKGRELLEAYVKTIPGSGELSEVLMREGSMLNGNTFAGYYMSNVVDGVFTVNGKSSLVVVNVETGDIWTNYIEIDLNAVVAEQLKPYFAAIGYTGEYMVSGSEIATRIISHDVPANKNGSGKMDSAVTFSGLYPAALIEKLGDLNLTSENGGILNSTPCELDNGDYYAFRDTAAARVDMKTQADTSAEFTKVSEHFKNLGITGFRIDYDLDATDGEALNHSAIVNYLEESGNYIRDPENFGRYVTYYDIYATRDLSGAGTLEVAIEAEKDKNILGVCGTVEDGDVIPNGTLRSYGWYETITLKGDGSEDSLSAADFDMSRKSIDTYDNGMLLIYRSAFKGGYLSKFDEIELNEFGCDISVTEESFNTSAGSSVKGIRLTATENTITTVKFKEKPAYTTFERITYSGGKPNDPTALELIELKEGTYTLYSGDRLDLTGYTLRKEQDVVMY
ncbi:MAG: hypothetical protein Q4B67_03895 [Eubacteriales bacterium]|nr:hypothetical protein [Eubacteriales bacterium]